MHVLLLISLFLLYFSSVRVGARQPLQVPPGIVTTKGTEFELDGTPFAFVGTNSYWLPLLTTQEDVEQTLKDMRGAGVKVLRTWGFNAVNGTELANAIASNLTYYQIWNSSQWILNDGPQGLERLDRVIEMAGKYDIKIILTFTNNWVGYGGSDLYIQWIAGANQTHDVFFTNKDIIASYQSYVKTIVERYKDSTTIFAWELMNEARCASDSLQSGPSCVPGSETLTIWYRQQADFVRSLDPNHMITTGGEGQFFWAKPATYWFNGTLVSDFNFNGEAGEDFKGSLGLENIDFGAYHMYPESWYPELITPGSNFSVEQWGLDWIDAHSSTAKMLNKPLLIEEFGLNELQEKITVYPSWVNRALESKHAIMPWQFGELNLTENGGNRLIKYSDAIVDGASPNDGLAIYPNETSVWDIFTNAAVIQSRRSSG